MGNLLPKHKFSVHAFLKANSDSRPPCVAHISFFYRKEKELFASSIWIPVVPGHSIELPTSTCAHFTKCICTLSKKIVKMRLQKSIS